MHIGSYTKIAAFVDAYLADYTGKQLVILDVGSQDVNGSYKPLFDKNHWVYTGCDMVEGKNVDICLKDIYNWSEFDSNQFDVVISGQVLEHVEYFWVTIFEIARILKEGGLCCIVAPSAGIEHRFPVDCWRYYPDGFRALAKYAGLEALEVFTEWNPLPYADGSGGWKDSVLVARKPILNEQQKRSAYYKNKLARLLIEEDIDLIQIENLLTDLKGV